MKNKHLYKVSLAAALIGVSLSFSSCGKDDDSSSSNSNGNTQEQATDSEEKLVSELKCTVAEFATKYTTLKKGEKVSVTLTDVSDNNLPQVAAVLQKMSGTKLSKAGSEGYIVVLVMESKDELTKIPAEIFKDCTAMVSVSIPECVELIESGAFDGCTALEAVKILSEVTVIQEGAFAENVKVEGGTQTEVVVKPEIKLLSPADIVPYVNASNDEIVTLNMALETYDHTDVMVEISKITDKKVKLVIPEGVKILVLEGDKLPRDGEGNGTYQGTTSLVGVEIPEGVTEIGPVVFAECFSLKSITLPESLTKIGIAAFENCNNLTGFSIPENVIEIGRAAFSGCDNITSLVIPYGVTKIESDTFFGCDKLSNITIPESVKIIGTMAFFASGISKITLPDAVTEIGDAAFYACLDLQTIYCSQALYDKYHEAYPQMVVKE